MKQGSRLKRAVEMLLVWALPGLVRVRPRERVKVLVLKPDRIGDFAIAAPTIQGLIERFGSEEVRLVVSHENAPLARRMFPQLILCEVPLYMPPSRWREWLPPMRTLAAIEAEYAFLFRHFWRPAHLRAMWRVVRAQHKLWMTSAEGYLPQSRSDSWLLGRDGVEFSGPMESGGVDAQLSLHLVKVAFGSMPTLQSLPPMSLIPGAITHESDVAVVFPFGSDPLRDLPASLLVAVTRHLWRTHRLSVLLCGTKDRGRDLDQLQATVASTLRDEGEIVPQAWVPGNFDECLEATLSSRIVFATETGPAHLAVAYDRPMVGLLGGGHFGLFAPWSVSARQEWVYHRLPCYGCDWNCRFTRAHCITDIPEENVLMAIDRVLGVGLPTQIAVAHPSVPA